ncbi:MAG: SH3 domain-containing protein [Turicibacter sp.]|nr:SH3 domain-containing protein [Turicibacter sp.]
MKNEKDIRAEGSAEIDPKKSNKRDSILKQLDDRRLYPIQERIGIYVVAVLSVVGLMLIGYTGVMAIATNAANAADLPTVDAEEVHEMLDEIDLNGEDEEYDEVEDNDLEQNFEYVTVPPTEAPTEPPTEAPTEPEEEILTATVINNLPPLRRQPGPTASVIANIPAGAVVEVLDYSSNHLWTQIYYDGDEGWMDAGHIRINW